MPNVINHTLFTELDVYLFRSGKHYRLYEKMGSHIIEVNGQWGTYFAVWAPNAQRVSVIGEFNHWDNKAHPLAPRWDGSGIWEGFIPGIGKGKLYKYFVQSRDGRKLEKGDPYARFWEIPPNTASITWEYDYKWNDQEWMANRKDKQSLSSPFSVYEVHLGSWKKSHGGSASLNYKQMAEEMVAYVKEMGFTHVEFLPVMEHPYYPSWGYQTTGYFAPTSRYGLPDDFMLLVDAFHQADIGVILDWVPSHFPEDAHGLADFDGTHLYDHADPRKGFHPDWKSCIYNYGRNEVRSFLISNALFWLEHYHIDGLRVDAVASMLYLDYSREEGQWIPNMYGGKENLEAISFLKEFNTAVYKEYPDAVTIAEESTSWEGVSHPTYDGGLGFGQKWMMGWMHDTLKYFKEQPRHRSYHQNSITFSMIYAFAENFMLPFSHDEVVHGKGSLLGRMPGDEWQQFANLRLLFGYMFTHPGTQLIFMGGEFGQRTEWSDTKGLEWKALEYHRHKEVQTWVKDLNHYYKNTPALYEKQFEEEGYEWIDGSDNQNSVLAFIRKGNEGSKAQVVVCHFVPTVIHDYRIGLPDGGVWKEVMNSDAEKYGGSNVVNGGNLKAIKEAKHGKEYALSITLSPLAVMIFEQVEEAKEEAEVEDRLDGLLEVIGRVGEQEKDDLKAIKGIGPKLEATLNDLGIYTYVQIAKMSEAEYEILDEFVGRFAGSAKRNDWVGQAKELE